MKAVYSITITALVAILLSFLIYCINGYFYPMQYVEEINAVATQYNLEPSLVASIINVESGYNPNRTSPKGAKGLMQLMPSTAEWLCENLKIEYDEEKLLQPEYNLNLGCYYLRTLLNRFTNVESAICAYNAGPTNVNNWLKNTEYSQDGQTLQKIPFEETRNYIIKVNKNLRYYNRKYK